MKTNALFRADRVRVDVTARSKKHALELIAQTLSPACTGVSANALFDAMIARERLGCTTLGNGVALPHCALPSIKSAAAAVLRLAQPIAFDDADPTPVSLIIAMAIPSQSQGADNDPLQDVCDLLSNGRYRRSLLAASSAAALYAKLRAEPPAAHYRAANA